MRIAAALALALAFTPAALAEPAKVKISSGTLVGDAADGIVTFKGIPFAVPPVGALRWKPPQPVAAWAGDRPATEYGASCSQNARLGAEAKTSEDCLYLNVFAPKDAKNLPVMSGSMAARTSTDQVRSIMARPSPGAASLWSR